MSDPTFMADPTRLVIAAIVQVVEMFLKKSVAACAHH